MLMSLCQDNTFIPIRFILSFSFLYIFYFFWNRIGDIMVSVLVSSAVDHRFKPPSGQIKDYEIGICCFSTIHTALRSKNKDWLAWNQDNVSNWSNMYIHGLLFQ